MAYLSEWCSHKVTDELRLGSATAHSATYTLSGAGALEVGNEDIGLPVMATFFRRRKHVVNNYLYLGKELTAMAIYPEQWGIKHTICRDRQWRHGQLCPEWRVHSISGSSSYMVSVRHR